MFIDWWTLLAVTLFLENLHVKKSSQPILSGCSWCSTDSMTNLFYFLWIIPLLKKKKSTSTHFPVDSITVKEKVSELKHVLSNTCQTEGHSCCLLMCGATQYWNNIVNWNVRLENINCINWKAKKKKCVRELYCGYMGKNIS